jgi:acetoin utilization protein AcuB
MDAMFIRNCLTPTDHVCKATITATIGEAFDLMEEKKLRSIPVVDEGNRFLGILSKRYLLEYFFRSQSTKSVKEFRNLPIDPAVESMDQSNVVTPEHIFEDCLPIIVKYPFVPVVEEGIFLGIIKRSDIEKALESTYGSRQKGVRLLLTIPEMQGSLNRLVKLLNADKENIISIATFDAGDPYRRIMVKITQETYHDGIEEILDEHGFRLLQKRIDE